MNNINNISDFLKDFICLFENMLTIANIDIPTISINSNDSDTYQKPQTFGLLDKVLTSRETYNMIDNTIRKFGLYIINTNNSYKGNHLNIYIKKWKKIYDDKQNDMFYVLFDIFILISRKKYIGTFRELILLEMQNYTQNNDNIHLHNIVNIAIINKCGIVLDKLKEHIDLNLYLDENVNMPNVDIKCIKGQKLLKFLKEKN